MESLRDELWLLSDIGGHFDPLSTWGVSIHPERTRLARQLRATLRNFCSSMKDASACLFDALHDSAWFYVHSYEELTKRDLPAADNRNTFVLLEAEFQAAAVEEARNIATLAARAAKTIREEVLPILPQLEKDLGEYVADYISRRNSIEERKKSWIPSVLQDAIWGSLGPLRRGMVEVEKMPQNLSDASRLLRKLPAFLDRFGLHFRRLSEITSQQIFDLGYTSSDDLNRLYRDRLVCNHIAESMIMLWIGGKRPFALGSCISANE